MASTLTRSESSGFLPVGIAKNSCVCSSVDNEEVLHYCTVDACHTIHNHTDIFERKRRSMMRHVEAHTESHRGHSEHLVSMYSFIHNSQIKCFQCFQTHVDLDISFSCFGM